MAVLRNPNNQGHRRLLRQAEGTAQTLGVQLQVLGASTASEIEAAFAAMTRQHAGGVLVLRDAVVRARRA